MKLPTGKPCAVACVRGAGELRGTVKFYAIPGGTLVAAEIAGLPENDSGFFAFHIHEGNNCGGEGFANAGGHFNPGGMEHPHHAGDLPPLLSQHGRAFAMVETDRFTPDEVIGRTAVVHREPDDFHTQPSGNSGARIGCGVICRCR